MKDEQLANVRLRKWDRAEKEGDGEAAESLLLSGLAAIRVLLNKSRAKADGYIPESDCVALEFLAEGLDRFAAGEEIGTALMLSKHAGRPKKHTIEDILAYVLPVSLLIDQGKNYKEAIKIVAGKAGVSTRTVQRAWDKDSGRRTNPDAAAQTNGVVELVHPDKN